MGGDKSVKKLDGFKIEFVEADGKYSEAVFAQPNGTFRAGRKDQPSVS